jgi:hypothetical protein
MKHNSLQLLLIVLALVFVFLPINNLYGGGYILVTGGNGGDSNEKSLGGELGWIGQEFLLCIGTAEIFSESGWKRKTPGAGYFEKNNDEFEFYGVAGVAVT